MRLVCISDTHTKHRRLDLPTGDILIHAGDLTYAGEVNVIEDFNDWVGEQKREKGFEYAVVIAGNHDFSLDPGSRAYDPDASMKLTNCLYLNDSGAIVKGLKFWGSPIQPWFHNWAFNRWRGEDIKKHWDMIPRDTDVLITHGPPYGFGDRPFGRQPSVGCKDLLETVLEIKPKLHVFGHIHGGYGFDVFNGTIFLNASSVDEAYKPVNSPVVFDI